MKTIFSLFLKASVILTTIAPQAFAATWQDITVGNYDVSIYVPDLPKHRPSLRSLMINLHGCDQTSQDLVDYGNWEDSADTHNMIVAIPDNNGDCFGYAPSPIYDTELAYESLLSVINELIDDPALYIDTKQIYISGFGAGGTVAMEMGCRYPDLIAGMGIASAPSAGSNQYMASFAPTMTANSVATSCLDFAGDKTEHFDTQIVSIISGGDGTNSDGKIYSRWSTITAHAFANLYDTEGLSEDTVIDGGSFYDITIASAFDSDENERVSRIFTPEMGHAWSAGATINGNGIDGNGLNYPEYLAFYLNGNNLKINQNDGGWSKPFIGDKLYINTTNSECHRIFGSAYDFQGEITSVSVNVHGFEYEATIAPNSKRFDVNTCLIVDSETPIYATAFDNEGAEASYIPKKVFLVNGSESNANIISVSSVKNEAGCLNISGAATTSDWSTPQISVNVGDHFYIADEVIQTAAGFEFTTQICPANDLGYINNNGTVIAIDHNQIESLPYIFEANLKQAENTDVIPELEITELYEKGGCIYAELYASVNTSPKIFFENIQQELSYLGKNQFYKFYQMKKCELEEGTYSVFATAQDDSENTVIQTDEVSIQVNKSNSLPTAHFGISPSTSTNNNSICFRADGIAKDEDGFISSVKMAVLGQHHFTAIEKLSSQVAKFSTESCFEIDPITQSYDYSYTIRILIEDNEGGVREYFYTVSDTDPAMPNYSPYITELSSYSNNDNCINIEGLASDDDGVITFVSIIIGDASFEADIQHYQSVSYRYSFSKCGYTPGDYNIAVTAFDNYGDPSNIAADTIIIDDIDTDNDGIGNLQDPDDDNDGVLDANDAFPLDPTENIDTDDDGIGNNADTDDDGDGALDANDAFPLDPTESIDTDTDGIGNNADTDDDGDGTLDANDAFPLDPTESIDTDTDGIGNNADTDDDGDGTLDANDAFPLDPSESIDTDSDGIGNNADTDDDNDGILDVNDEFPLNPSESIDTDKDGIPNNTDIDDDNDGILDVNDTFPLDPSESIDTDNDKIGNNTDTDDDNDGVLDVNDAFPLDPSESIDTDNDKIGNNTDTDDDNDGALDVNDAFPLDPSESIDTDNDKIGNNTDTDDDNDGALDVNDAFPLDPSESIDTDADGIGNNADTDDDGDGTLDANDAFPLDPTESIDTDNDGIGNNADTDDDGDGSLDINDAFPLDPTESIDTDLDGIGNNTDTDDDGDGVADSEDAYPQDPNKSEPEPEPLKNDNSGSGGGGSTSIFILVLAIALIRKRPL